MRTFAVLVCAISVAPSAFSTPVSILPGFDSFKTGSIDFSFTGPHAIPAGFFAPGSNPFTGTVTFQGGPFVPSSAGPLTVTNESGVSYFGPATIAPVDPLSDTVIQRPGGVILGDGATEVIPIQLVQLHLQSVSPITVTHPTEPDSFFDIFVDLPVPGNGSMVLKRTGATNGGTFDSTLVVQPRFTFTRTPGPPTTVLLFASDALSISGEWSVTVIPEPATWFTVAGALGLGLLLRRRRGGGRSSLP